MAVSKRQITIQDPLAEKGNLGAGRFCRLIFLSKLAALSQCRELTAAKTRPAFSRSETQSSEAAACAARGEQHKPTQAGGFVRHVNSHAAKIPAWLKNKGCRHRSRASRPGDRSGNNRLIKIGEEMQRVFYLRRSVFFAFNF